MPLRLFFLPCALPALSSAFSHSLSCPFLSPASSLLFLLHQHSSSAVLSSVSTLLFILHLCSISTQSSFIFICSCAVLSFPVSSLLFLLYLLFFLCFPHSSSAYALHICCPFFPVFSHIFLLHLLSILSVLSSIYPHSFICICTPLLLFSPPCVLTPLQHLHASCSVFSSFYTQSSFFCISTPFPFVRLLGSLFFSMLAALSSAFFLCFSCSSFPASSLLFPLHQHCSSVGLFSIFHTSLSSASALLFSCSFFILSSLHSSASPHLF